MWTILIWGLAIFVAGHALYRMGEAAVQGESSRGSLVKGDLTVERH